MKALTLGIIGCGNMGRAIARGMVKKGTTRDVSILLYDKEIGKADALAKETGCVREGVSSLVRKSDLLLIAVKPQDSGSLFDEISGDIKGQTIVSVMAGVKISAITGRLGKEVPVVRAMPNMAAFVGESITCISCNDMVVMIEEVKNIFTSIGKVREVDETFMDGVTALSGSGPAYLFYLAEAMIAAGENMGLDKDIVRELVTQTLYGSAVFMRGSEESPGELIGKIASRGGTTEAALSVFNENDMRSIVERAVSKAKERSVELSRG